MTQILSPYRMQFEECGRVTLFLGGSQTMTSKPGGSANAEPLNHADLALELPAACRDCVPFASRPDRAFCAIPLPPFFFHKNLLQPILHPRVCSPENSADSRSISGKPAGKTWSQDWIKGHASGNEDTISSTM